MTSTTIRVRFPVRRVVHRVVHQESEPAAPPLPECKGTPAPRPVSRAARMLALAHHVEREIQAGNVQDLAAAAHALGITRARMTQVSNLLLLAPGVQARILTGDLRWSERRLRAAQAEPDWEAQRARVLSPPREGRDGPT